MNQEKRISRCKRIYGKLAATKEVYSLTEDGSLDSTINNGNVQVNDTIAYQISVANTGDRATEVKNVHLQDQLPKGLTYVPNSLELTIGDTVTALKDEDTINIEKQAIDALVGTLKGGEIATLTFKVTVTKEASGEITNIATSKGNVITEPTDPKLPEEDKPQNLLRHMIQTAFKIMCLQNQRSTKKWAVM